MLLAGGSSALRVRDLSQSGVAFYSESPLPLMTRVKFELALPHDGGEPQSVQGEGAVVRCERVSPALGHYEVAIFFQHLDESGSAVLKSYLNLAMA